MIRNFRNLYYYKRFQFCFNFGINFVQEVLELRRSNDRYNIEDRKVPDLVGKIKTFPVFLLFGSFFAGELVSTILVFLLKITVQRFSISS